MKRTWKQIGSLFLALCMVVTMLPGVVFAAEGDEFTVDNLNYKVLTEGSGGNPGTVALVGHVDDPTGTLTVAEEVYSEGITYSITEIGNDAFSLCYGITEVIIGDSVETVDDGAFGDCSALADITLGNSLKTIGNNAFSGTNITSINLPASVEVIGEDAFYGCEELAGFMVDEANSNFSAENGVLYSKDGKTLILYPAGKTGDSFTIPDSVETIGTKAFYGNHKLNTIDTANVVTIVDYAFAGSALESITIGHSLETISEYAFANCQYLETVTISANSLLENIGDCAFYTCEALKSIDLPASLKTIGAGAFGYCHSLESLWIGPLVDVIGTNAFFAEKLADFTVAPANENYSSADSVLYDKNKTTLIRYMQGKTDTSFSIPDTVAKIEQSAFYATDKLETVTIPSAVNNIGDSAFYWSGIKSITFLGETPPVTVGSGIFASCSSLTDIYVPEGSVDAYKSALGVDYASMVTALPTIDQAGWEALIAGNGAAINDGDIFILGEDVTGSLYRSNSLPNLTIDGNGHTINGDLTFALKINLTLKDISIQGSDNWEAIRFNNSSEGSRLITSGTVAITGGKGKGGLGFYGEAGVYSNADLTITASGETTITAGDADEVYHFSQSAVWVDRGSLTLDGGSPTFQGGKGYSSYGALVGKTGYPGDLIITSGSPVFKGGSFNDIGIDGADVTGTIRISSAGSPQFIGTDGKGDSNSRANGARALNLEITAGAPIFKGGSASGSEWGSFAGNGIYLSDSATISGTASPAFTGGDGAASECGGAGLIFWGGLTVSTSGDVTYTGGSNCRYAIEEGGGGSATKTGINLKDLTGKITIDNTQGRYGAIGLLEGTITYPEGLAEVRKYNGTDKTYTLDMGDENPTDHAVTVTNGTASPNTASAGTTVTITANTAPSGQRFKEWSISPAVTFVDDTNKNSQTAKFTMPDQTVTAAATYEAIPGGETAVTGVTLNRLTLSLYSNTTPNTATLTATVAPADATDKTVTWQSSNTAVATVDANGRVTAVGNGTAVITVTTADGGYTASCTVTVTIYSSGGSGDNGGGSSSGGSRTTPTTPPAAPAPSTTGSTATATVTSTTGADGKAAASVPAAQVDNTLKQARDAAAKSGEAPKVEIKVEAPANTTAVETKVPKAAMAAIASGDLQDLTISSPVANLTFDRAALNTIAGAAGDVSFSASKVDSANLPAAVQTLIGNRPVYEFSVTSGGNTISQFRGNVTVAVPYQLGTGEDPNAVIISFINAGGNLEIVTNGRYDAATGTVVFTTDHFSKYAIGYNKIDFTDVADSAWYVDAVTFLAARGITSGTTATTFSPDGTLTRGQLITLLMRAYDMAADEKTENNFSDSGNTYYTGYLAAAKRLGIAKGVGENKFAPEQAITRQEMFTMLYNALKALDKLPSGDSGKTLADFTDSGSVADWATEALNALAKSGTVAGSGSKLDPTVGSTRAQMAQVLYNLLGK